MPNRQLYAMEITDVEAGEIILVSADWTAKERDLALSGVLRLV
jgi:hypothetical protein